MNAIVLIIQMIQLVWNSYTMLAINCRLKAVHFVAEPSDPGCFKNQDPEKYCLNHNDPTFCKTIGDICDADGFVRPEDVYCKND
jgi:hypothetical protein